MIRHAGLVIVGLAIIGAAAWMLGTHDIHAWDLLAGRLRALHDLAAAHALQAAALYVLIYAAVVACGLPLGPPMSVAGGSLFGLWGGWLCAILAITGGSLALFLAARSALGRMMPGRGDGRLDRVRARVARDGFWALLALRMAPVVPGWLVNLAAALTLMRVRPFLAATALAVSPATFVFASLGTGLELATANDAPPDVGVILQPRILLPLLALSALVLLPIIRSTKLESSKR